MALVAQWNAILAKRLAAFQDTLANQLEYTKIEEKDSKNSD